MEEDTDEMNDFLNRLSVSSESVLNESCGPVLTKESFAALMEAQVPIEHQDLTNSDRERVNDALLDSGESSAVLSNSQKKKKKKKNKKKKTVTAVAPANQWTVLTPKKKNAVLKEKKKVEKEKLALEQQKEAEASKPVPVAVAAAPKVAAAPNPFNPDEDVVHEEVFSYFEGETKKKKNERYNFSFYACCCCADDLIRWSNNSTEFS